MNIQKVTSAAGLEAWLVEEHAVPMLALGFAFLGGSAQDTAGKGGTAAFLAEMLDQGAGDLSGLAFQERVRGLALGLQFNASKDAFFGSLNVLTESRERATELLRLALSAPRFDGDAVERVRERLMVDIAQAARDPGELASAEWDAVAFAGHPYARPVSGSAESIATITADDLEAYRRGVLVRDTLKVVAVGDINPADLAALLDDVFGSIPAAGNLTSVPDIKHTSGGRLSIIEMDVPQSVVAFGLPGIGKRDPDYFAAAVLDYIIGGGGFSSRLMEEVRVKRGLAYSVWTALATSRHTAVLKGGVATRNELVGHSIDIIRSELGRIARGQIGAHELGDAQSYLVGSYPLAFDSNAKIASQLLGLSVDGLAPDYVDNRNARVAAVTLEDLKRVAKRLLDPSNLIITVVGKPVLGMEHSDAATVEAA